jgi:hypothetical protein
VLADTLKFECERRAVVQDRTTYGIAMESVYLCWLLLRLITKYWALAEGQVGLFATDRRLLVIGQRKIETPAAAKNKETSCAYDQDGRQPLSRATQQGHSSAAPFSRCVRVATIAFLSPPARLPRPPPHDMKDGRMAGGQNDMSISKSISRSN